jgi:hypothetical protein
MPRACPECGAAGGEPHAIPCTFDARYRAARGPLFEWLASLPEEYERLKARAAGRAAVDSGPALYGSTAVRGAPVPKPKEVE